MPKPQPITLGVLLRVHDRPTTTRIILEEFKHWAAISPPELLIRTTVIADRPTTKVDDLCRRALDDKTIVAYYKAHKPLLAPDGEHLTESQNWQLNVLEMICTPDWCYLSDDDRFIEPVKARKFLLPSLQRTDVDVFFFESLFFYGDSDTYTTTRSHHSGLLWRHQRGARFSCTREIHVPDELYDAAIMRDRVKDFPAPILDYGTFSHEECLKHVARFNAIGKNDDYTKSALLPPKLKVFPHDYDPGYGAWIDRMAEAQRAAH